MAVSSADGVPVYEDGQILYVRNRGRPNGFLLPMLTHAQR